MVSDLNLYRVFYYFQKSAILLASATTALECWTCNSGSIEQCRSEGYYQNCDGESGNGIDSTLGNSGARSPEYFHEYKVFTEGNRVHTTKHKIEIISSDLSRRG